MLEYHCQPSLRENAPIDNSNFDEMCLVVSVEIVPLSIRMLSRILSLYFFITGDFLLIDEMVCAQQSQRPNKTYEKLETYIDISIQNDNNL